MKIEWSPRAERELTQLRDYIAQDSPFYARQFIERLVLAEGLATLPRSGRTVPEAGHQDAIREVLYQGYRLIYRIRDDQQLVQIVTVLHGARDLAHMASPWPTPAAKPAMLPMESLAITSCHNADTSIEIGRTRTPLMQREIEFPVEIPTATARNGPPAPFPRKQLAISRPLRHAS